ncbi:MAG: tetratricopeptide repeat protein [Planctomycetes bacterium]|nr:tetratricopeptide repeat protein [Planctomycetota bacterium]
MRTERALLLLVLAAAAAFAGTRVSAAETAEDLFAQAEAKYRKGEYEEAVKLYRGVIAKFGGDAHAEEARYTSAFILQKKLGKQEEARKQYQEILDKKAAGPLLANSLYHLAECFEQADRGGQALAHYEVFAKKFPNDSRARLVNSRIEYLRNKANGAKYPEGEKSGAPEKDNDDKKPRKPAGKTAAESAPPAKNEPAAGK